MKNKKYFILLFGYTRIQLFTEIDGKITNINFSNGKSKLSNCVTFSYDREDLEYLPDGDPFKVSQNSSFSDYLDFAGYHFDSLQAIETIVDSIISNGLIPNLGKNDDIFLYLQAFYFESKEFGSKGKDHIDVCEFKTTKIGGHNVIGYDSYMLINMVTKQLIRIFGANALIGYPFLTIVFVDEGDALNTIFAPTLERLVLEKVNERYPLHTHIPEKLLRNIGNRIITSKLLDLPLPDYAIYQNRKVDIAKTNLSKHFDEILIEDANFFIEKTEEIVGPTLVFDLGMHPTIKKSFLSRISEPIFMEKEDNAIITAFLLRTMIIQHIMGNDPLFKKEAVRINKRGKDVAYLTYGGNLYFDTTFMLQYLAHFKKSNVLSNIETKELLKLCKDKLKDFTKRNKENAKD